MQRNRYFAGKMVRLLFMMLAAAALAPTAALAQLSQSKIILADRDSLDFFGDAIAVSGNRILAGLSRDDDKGNAAGAAYVFERIDGQWQQTAKLLADGGDELDFFGTDVALDGDRALIGADSDGEIDCPPPSIFDDCFTGAAYVFEYRNGRWRQTAKLTPATPFFNHSSGAGTTAIRFGGAVALNGDQAIISAPDDFEATVQGGSLHAFEFDNGTWTELQKITATDIGDGGHFLGFGLDVDGDRLVAGAPVADVDGVRNAGLAVVFERLQGGTEWNQTAVLEAAEPDTSATIGRNVEVEDVWAFVGAAFDHEACLPGSVNPDQCFGGAVLVFKRGTSAWSQVDKLTADDAGEGDLFGLNLLIEGDRAYIGAPREDEGCPPDDETPFGCNAGAVYSYQLVGDQWQFQNKLLADDDTELVQGFGLELAMDGPWLAVGAPSDILFGQDSIPDFGAIYVYKMFNRDPVAQDDEAATDAGAPVTIDVLTNDTDPDADALSINIADQPDNGSAAVNADGTITYTPNGGFGGNDPFTYTLNDGDGGTDEATVAVTVNQTSNAPSAPQITSPSDGETIAIGGSVQIPGDPNTPFEATWTESTDPNGDDVSYAWQLATTDDFSQVLMTVDTGTETRYTTTFGVLSDLLEAQGVQIGASLTLYHRAVASDGTNSTTGPTARVTFIRAVLTATEDEAGIPTDYVLAQNYPNPFNPETRITFGLPQASEVRLMIYDVLGREVAVLVDTRLPAGRHEAAFEANDLPSGVYVYRLEAGSRVLARTMLLMK